jgi:PAS domain S-box-containing protein
MKRAKIMVVEDEGIVAADIQDRLRALGYGVAAVVESGAEAERTAGSSRPDLVLMDIFLKGDIDGVEAAERIRTHWDIPVVFLTAHADETTLQRAKITAPFGYILKPFNDRELHTTVEIALFRHAIEARLKRTERWLSAVLESIGDAVVATDKWGLITFLNPAAEAFTGWAPNDALNKPLAEVLPLLDETTRQPVMSPVSKIMYEETGINWRNPLLLLSRTGAEMPVDYTAAPIRDDQSNITGIVWIFREITQDRQAEADRARLSKELQGALANVKTLSGLLPICAGCKKIRDDQGYWRQVESYIQKHSEATFTHGLCPECSHQLYPELDDPVPEPTPPGTPAERIPPEQPRA